jgi:hypothetical protein
LSWMLHGPHSKYSFQLFHSFQCTVANILISTTSIQMYYAINYLLQVSFLHPSSGRLTAYPFCCSIFTVCSAVF